MNSNYTNLELTKDYRKLGFGPVNEAGFSVRVYPECSSIESELKKLADEGLLYNFITDSKFILSSRIREYKGAFNDRSIKLEKKYLEKEVFLTDKISAFVGIRQVNPNYFDEKRQFHHTFRYSFLLISREIPIEILDNCEKFLEMRRTDNSICYERLLKHLEERTLIKYWRLENDNYGYIFVRKGQSGGETR